MIVNTIQKRFQHNHSYKILKYELNKLSIENRYLKFQNKVLKNKLSNNKKNDNTLLSLYKPLKLSKNLSVYKPL